MLVRVKLLPFSNSKALIVGWLTEPSQHLQSPVTLEWGGWWHNFAQGTGKEINAFLHIFFEMSKLGTPAQYGGMIPRATACILRYNA